MRIALVSADVDPLRPPDGHSAGSRHVRLAGLCRTLRELGHDPRVYTRRYAGPRSRPRIRADHGLAVEYLPAGPCADAEPTGAATRSSRGNTAGRAKGAAGASGAEGMPQLGTFASHLAQSWSQQPPDVVHAHGWVSGVVALVAARTTGSRVPVVVTFHSLALTARRHGCPPLADPTGRIRLEKAVGHDAAHVLATGSDEVVDLLRMGVPRQAISVVPSGVETDQFHPEGPVGEPVVGSGQGAPRARLIAVSRLRPDCGLDTVLTALARVPEAELVVAGGPTEAELGRDPEYLRLAELARRAGVAGRVRFLGGVPRADLPALLRSADLMVHLPAYEPCGLSVLEAMACGLPVVASAAGEPRDSVVDGSTGVLVPPRRPELLAISVRRLLADPVRRQGYGIAGADRARVRYAWNRVAADTLEIYPNGGTDSGGGDNQGVTVRGTMREKRRRSRHFPD
jgi:D-inositol-3-phosphate glycosyltransferase